MLVQTSRSIHGQILSTKARGATELSAEGHSEFSEPSRSCSADVASTMRSLDEDIQRKNPHAFLESGGVPALGVTRRASIRLDVAAMTWR